MTWNLNDLNKLTKHEKMAAFRSPLQQNEHCPVCDEHVPVVRFTGSVLELEQIDDDTWILADGSIAVEDGHGGLMVSLCIDCATEHNVLKKRNWCTKTLV